jgi:hypothetical protein
MKLTAIFLLCLASLPSLAQDQPAASPEKIEYCTVLASPRAYDKKQFETEVILDETNGARDVYGAACPPLASHDNRAQAILPNSWESTEAGKQLKAILQHHRKARIKVVATFHAFGGPYGPSVAPFRLTIESLISVSDIMVAPTR